jgi:hypothetical protein
MAASDENNAQGTGRVFSQIINVQQIKTHKAEARTILYSIDG